MRTRHISFVLPALLLAAGPTAPSQPQARGSRPASAPAPAAGLKQMAFIKASHPGEGDQFGYSIALSGDGNTLVVGAPMESSSAKGINGNEADNSKYASGAVYVYARSSSGWARQAYIKASNPGQDDQFGFSVALSGDGNTLAVSATYEDGGATGVNSTQTVNPVENAGAVYVFTRAGTTWSQ